MKKSMDYHILHILSITDYVSRRSEEWTKAFLSSTRYLIIVLLTRDSVSNPSHVSTIETIEWNNPVISEGVFSSPFAWCS